MRDYRPPNFVERGMKLLPQQEPGAGTVLADDPETEDLVNFYLGGR